MGIAGKLSAPYDRHRRRGRAVSGHANCVLPKSLMNSRRSMGFPRAEGHVGQVDNITFLDRELTSPVRLIMSALGHKRTSDHVQSMSAIPPIADINRVRWNAGFVPKADKVRRSKNWFYSITSSATANSGAGIARTNAFAVFRLITKSNFVGSSTGISAGLAPFRILSIRTTVRRHKSSSSTP
jgi:hypothetical protein